jgi:AraC-like DNA-binding protein
MTSPIQHSILATFILPIAQALRLRGLEAMEIIESAGIDPSGVINSDRRISVDSMQKLMQTCIELSEDEAFGLFAAEQMQPQVLHGLGLAWLASDTVYDGLKRTVRFGQLMSTGVTIRLEEAGEFVHLIIDRNIAPESYAHASGDFAVGMILRMCRLALGEFIAPVKVELERPAPANPEPFEYFLCCPVAFGCETTQITFYLPDIQEPLATGDPGLARVNDAQTQGYLDSFLSQTTSREVVDKIVEKLPDGPPNQQQIADSLNVSNRTLQRKLKNEGTSFMDLLQDTRMQLARSYLMQPTRSVVETSYLLGFSEPSTFSRAFKRWTGQAPAEFRDNPPEQ